MKKGKYKLKMVFFVWLIQILKELTDLLMEYKEEAIKLFLPTVEVKNGILIDGQNFFNHPK